MLPWDTEFFGFRIARTTSDLLDKGSVASINSWCLKHDVECLYALVGGDNFKSIHAAENAGFHLMGMKLELEYGNLQNLPVNLPKTEITVRKSEPDDVPKLLKLTEGLYTQSRFYADPHFSDKLCSAFFNTWIQKSCEGYADEVLVAECGHKLQGYITLNLSCEQNSDKASIGLIGVCPQSRGQGIGSLLLSRALQWAADNGKKNISVLTQGQNCAAVRLYENSGFTPTSVNLWYHRWTNE